ncbi:unnamed protein product [Nippostrongylus brasiliensis]|uniref:Histone-lysine N-methyltransferase SETMAR n=1 Tax=Nippostrongylus brasiliensis TaxID=27835 RepID=A0A0N4XWQ7_NIPBR|nr:unnamed protein product [Nippostrongylus brasiliensis]
MHLHTLIAPAISQPPYSPDLTPSDYWLFSHLQRHLEGKQFKKESDLKADLKAFFASQHSEFWEKGIDHLRTPWQEVVNADGAYL